jgi:hypothetical protein
MRFLSSLGFPVNLAELAKVLEKKVHYFYNPRLTPNHIDISWKKPDVIFSLFSDGQLECSGCTSKKEANRATKRLWNFLKDIGFQIKQGKSEISIKEVTCLIEPKIEINEERHSILRENFPQMSLGRSVGGRFETMIVPIGEGIVKLESTGEISTRGFKSKKEAIKALQQITELLLPTL